MAEAAIVVIGGGLGGLFSAGLLAKSGRRVVLVERGQHLGGRARSRVEHGFVHNLGAHAFYRGGAAARLLAALGVEPRGRYVDGSGGWFLQGGEFHALPRGLRG